MTSFAAAGFAKGFATGFINERNRRLDEQKSKDEITLRYQLEQLSNQREDWKKKSEQEQKYIDAAKFVADQVDNPAFAATALQYIKNGYDQSDVIKMYQNGEFEQVTPAATTIEVPNEDREKNKSKISSVAVPAGVRPVSMQPLPGIDVKADPKTATTPAVQTADQTAQMPTLRADPDTLERLDRVNKQIDEIDPTLRTYAENNKLPTLEAPENILKDGSSFKYLGPTKKIDLGTYEEEKAKLEDAIERGDKVAEARQRRYVRIMQETREEEAARKARAEGKNIRNKVIVDSNGIMKNIVKVDEEGRNIATGNIVTLGQNETMVDLSDEDVKYIRDVQKDFDKPKQEYDMQKAITLESVELGKEIHDLMNKPGNEHLNATSTGALNMINDAFANVESVRQMLGVQYNTIQAQKAKLDELLKNNASVEDFSSELANLNSLIETADKEMANLPHNSLAGPLQQQALDKIRLDNALLKLAYNSALANGQTAGKMSDKDLAMHMKTSGKDAQTKQGLLAIVYSQLLAQRRKLDVAQKDLKGRAQDRLRTLPPGFDIGLSPKRLGDYLKEEIMSAPDQKSKLNAVRKAQFFDDLETNYNRMSTYTQDEMARSKKAAEQTQDLPVIHNPADAFKLPPGTKFKNPAGEILTVPE